MTAKVRDVMETALHSIPPNASVGDLIHSLIEHRVSGLPVVEEGGLVGVVSRSDIVRRLEVERTQEEQISDFYRQLSNDEHVAAEEMKRLGAKVGERLEGMSVRDVMARSVITIDQDAPVMEAAQILVKRDIHRLPVVDGDGRLTGILTGHGLVRLIAEGRLD